MEWFIVAVIGFIVGTIASFFTQAFRMPQALTLALAIVGSLFGGALHKITDIDVFGTYSFYLSGVLVAIGFLAGGALAFTLTRSEKRI